MMIVTDQHLRPSLAQVADLTGENLILTALVARLSAETGVPVARAGQECRIIDLMLRADELRAALTALDEEIRVLVRDLRSAPIPVTQPSAEAM